MYDGLLDNIGDRLIRCKNLEVRNGFVNGTILYKDIKVTGKLQEERSVHKTIRICMFTFIRVNSHHATMT